MSEVGKKRKISDTEWDVSEIEEADGTCVHEVPIAVSPLKKSRKNAAISYFHGELRDGKKVVRMVSFDASLQK